MSTATPNLSEDPAQGGGMGPRGHKPRVRIARYDAFWNQQNRQYELKKSHKPAVAAKLKRKRFIFLVKRLINAAGKYVGTAIELHHKGLQNLLADMNRDVIGLDLTTPEPTLDMKFLFHSRRQLETKRQELKDSCSPEDKDLVEAILAAEELIEGDLAVIIKDVQTLIDQQQITYQYLWTIFPPNCYVIGYSFATGQHIVARARSLEYKTDTTGNYVRIKCDIIVRDSTGFGLAADVFIIREFPGTRTILELPLYPVQYHPGWEDLRNKAITRGKKYVDLRMHFCQHQGIATVTVGGSSLKIPINERVMIDVESFSEFRSGSRFLYEVYRQLDSTELTDDQYMICTPIILGFCFTTKAWGAFAIDRITDVTWSDEPFERLVLGHKQKLLISSLVKQHILEPKGFDDVVAGKGRGLVGLLCGNPGCGKTLTAEAVAEITHKPLYSVSAGELGTYPDATDDALRRILRLGERWNAVVLLDEADVFLQERDKTDVSRNALVSIFLRQVEYHPGILIFTTNLIRQIDHAFESRIHFCVKYPDLNIASRKAIWRTFLNKAQVSEDTFNDLDVARLAEQPLNGRQIKNIVSTAKSVALSEAAPVSIQHVHTVLDVMQDWTAAKSERAGGSHALHATCLTLGVAGVICFLLVSIWWRFAQ